MRRRDLFPMLSAGFDALAFGFDSDTKDPWSASELIETEILAPRVQQSKIISVAFPVLFRQRHIPGAIPAGPTNKPEGIALLTDAVSKFPKSTEIVIYCGCCPMEHCPNIRPAYTTLRNLQFSRIRVLHLPTSFRKDWEDKGFPVEPPRG